MKSFIFSITILNRDCFLRSPGIDLFWFVSVIKLNAITLIILSRVSYSLGSFTSLHALLEESFTLD